jgi:cyclophilin family peptidyl-prolyl cis-trans isomerase
MRTKRAKSKRSNVIDRLEQRMLLSATLTHSIPAPTLQQNGTPATLYLGNYFNDPTIPTGDLALELQTNLAAPDNVIPMYLTTNATPITVDNFLHYISSGEYANTMIHRSVPGFVIQGGGFKNDGTAINVFGTISGESSTEVLHNTTGTIAMALTGTPTNPAPNSGTSQWFFNLENNPDLDNSSDGGPFTVFGSVVYQGLNVLDYIAGLPIVNDTANPNFGSLPVISGTNGATVSSEPASNVVSINPFSVPTGMSYTINSSSTSVVTSSYNAGNLTLTPHSAGSATINITAEDMGGGTATTSFTVTVQSLPTVFIGAASGTVGTNSTITFPVTLSAASSSPTTLNYSVTPSSSDYSAQGSSLTIPAGSTTGSIVVNLHGDSSGATETFTTTLSSLSSNATFSNGNSTESATGTIHPASTTKPAVSIASATGTVGTNSKLTFPVTLSSASSSATTLSYSITPASSDYTLQGSTLTIPAGSTTGSINVTLNGDNAAATETFTATLSNLSSNAIFANDLSTETATGTIYPKSTPIVSVANASGTIGTNSQLVFPITLSNASSSAITLNYTLSPSNSDYQSEGNSVSIPAGSTTASIVVTLNGDSTNAVENFTVVLANLSNNAAFADGSSTETATGTINPQSMPGIVTTSTALNASSPAVVVGGSETFTATVTAADGSVPTGTVLFNASGATLGTGTLSNGVASFTTTLATAGDEVVTAVYSGDSTHSASTSTAVTVNAQTLTPSVAKSTLPSTVIGGVPAHGTEVVGLVNNTAAAETGTVTVSIYASTNGSVDSSSVLISTVHSKVKIAPGKSVSIPVAIKSLPANLSAGTYTLVSQTVDTTGAVSNAAAGPALTVSAPVHNLTESFAKLTVPTSVVAGSKTNAVAVVTITNTGNVASVGLDHISLYASTDGIAADGTLIKTLNKKLSIKPGKSVNVTIPLGAYPLVSNGNYNIVAEVVDGYGATTQAASSSTVNIAAATADLSAVITDVPSTATTARPFAVTLVVSDAGNYTISKALDIAFALSSASTGVNAFAVETEVVKFNIKPGGSETLHLKVKLPSGTSSGSEYLTATVDSTDVLNDTNLANNFAVSTSPITIG